MQIGLDKRQECYIIMFTADSVYGVNNRHEERNCQKNQTRFTQATWDAEPASRLSDGLAVSGKRFLRLRRCNAGEVRDASSSQSGQPTNQPVCFSFRFFSPNVLPSRSRFRAEWAIGARAAKTGATEGTQTDTGSDGLRDAVAFERPFDSFSRVSGRDQKAVQRDCPSAQRRACSDAAGKKTSLAKAVRVKDTQALISAYEELRRQAIDHSTLRDLDMGLLLSQGMVVWMQACSWVPSTTSTNLPLLPASNAPVPHGFREEIIRILAAMALRQVSEVHP